MTTLDLKASDEKELYRLRRLLVKARGRLPESATRARRTTLNARWARAAEDRDRLEHMVADLEAALNGK